MSKKPAPKRAPETPAPPPAAPKPVRVWVEFDDDVAPAEMNADAPVRVEFETKQGDPQRYGHCALGDVLEHLGHPNDGFEVYNGSRWRGASLTEAPKPMRVTMTFEVEARANAVEDAVGVEIADLVRKAIRGRDGHGHYTILSIQDIHAPSEAGKG